MVQNTGPWSSVVWFKIICNICISPNKLHTCFFELLAVPGQVEVMGMAGREEMFVKGDHIPEAEPLVFLGCLFSRFYLVIDLGHTEKWKSTAFYQ